MSGNGKFEDILKRGLKKIQSKLFAQEAAPQAVGQPARMFYNPDWAPNWDELLVGSERELWNEALKQARSGKRVLIATSTGGNVASTPIESLVGLALMMRGAQVEFMLCDKFLPGCLQTTSSKFANVDEFISDGPSEELCSHCYEGGYAIFEPLGLPIHQFSHWVTPEQKKAVDELSSTLPYGEIEKYVVDGMPIGQHALAGALRFFARGSLADEAKGEQVLRRYFNAGLLTMHALSSLLDENKYDCIFFNHGIYVPHGVLGEVARRRGIRLVNWNIAYRKQCAVFSHGDTYHHTMMTEPTARWENMDFTPEMEKEIMSYLQSRLQGTKDWIWFHEHPQEDLKGIARELNIDFSKPTIGLLTNVIWDAQLHYPANAFPSMVDWLLRTIEYFTKRPDLQLVIRAHPAEITGMQPSRQLVVDEIKRAFPTLPSNIFVIPPDSNISTYKVMMQCDSVIVYGTKTGVELSSLGIPIIVAGEAWIRNKGVTIDATSADGYFDILNSLPLGKKMDEAQTRRARMYAYHFFFRRMIPFTLLKTSPGWPPYKIVVPKLKDVLPGNDLGLDVVCDGILNGTDFIYPAEKLPQSMLAPQPAGVK